MSYKAVIPIVSGIAYVSNPIPELVKGSRTPYREYTPDFKDLAPRSRDDAFAREIQNLTGVYDFQIRIFRALGSGKHWVGVSFWDNEEFEDYTQRNLVVTLQSGKSWGVAENKVLRWLRGSDKKRGHYDETGAGSIGFLRRVLEHVKWTISGARSVSPVAGRPLKKPVRLKVGWGNDKRERAYAWLTRLGFTKVADAGDGDPAYVLDIVGADRNPADLACVRNGGKTYAELMEELRWLGPGVVALLMSSGSLVNCGVVSEHLGQYLHEKGFVVANNPPVKIGFAYGGHYNRSVYTADRGWVKVDATAIQFEAPISEREALRKEVDDPRSISRAEADAIIATNFEPVIKWSVAGLLDGVKTFEISISDNHTPSSPHQLVQQRSVLEGTSAVHKEPTWRKYWEFWREAAADLTTPDLGWWQFTPLTRGYWVPEVSRRVQGKRISGRETKANPTDLAGRHIPERYLAGLPPELQQQRIRELTQSRDAYKRGDYSELPTDRAARKMGLVKQSQYTTEAKKRGIEYRGDFEDMASRVMKFYGHRPSAREVGAFADALRKSFSKGLAAWKSGGHRPGATAQNWAVARVNSLVVGGKTSWTADKKQFAVLPEAVRQRIESMRTVNKNPSPMTQTPAFRKWFAGSKVVDDQGNPLRVYHGTTADFSAFDKSKVGSFTRHPTARMGFFFSPKPDVARQFAGNTRAMDFDKVNKELESGRLKLHDVFNVVKTPEGTSLTPNHMWDPRGTLYFPVDDGAKIIPVYLSIKNPLVLPWSEFITARGREGEWHVDRLLERAERIGHDGIHVPPIGAGFTGDEEDHGVWIAFEPTQIKSAVGNSGAFSTRDPDILANPAELYHTTRSGPNGETVQSFARGVDPNRAQGFGQGAGFFLWRTKAKALEHARGMLAGDFMKEEQVTGEPIIVVIDEPVRPETFDIDYEDMGPAFLRVLEKHKDWIRAHKAELSASINDDGLGIRIWGHGQMSRSLKFDSDTLMASHGASLGRLGRTIATLFPEVMEQFEREMFTTARALKYVGPAGILPKRIETIDGTVIWSRARSNPINVQVKGTPGDAKGRHGRFFQSRAALDRIEEQGRAVIPSIEFIIDWDPAYRAGARVMKGKPGQITLLGSPRYVEDLAHRRAGYKARSERISLYTAHTVLHRLGDMMMPDDLSHKHGSLSSIVKKEFRKIGYVPDRVDRATAQLVAAFNEASKYLQRHKELGGTSLDRSLYFWLPRVVDTKACREGWVNDPYQAMAELVPYRLLYPKGRENGVKLLSDLPFVPQLEAAFTEYIDANIAMLEGYLIEI
jgi:hypothetical protein